MLFSTSVARRAAIAAAGAGAIAGVMLFSGAPSALADPPPAVGCSAADFEQVKGDVSVATAGYFFTHPDANAFFSTLKGQPRDSISQQVKDYYAANPQVQSEMAGIRQPMRDFKARCQ